MCYPWRGQRSWAFDGFQLRCLHEQSCPGSLNLWMLLWSGDDGVTKDNVKKYPPVEFPLLLQT